MAYKHLKGWSPATPVFVDESGFRATRMRQVGVVTAILLLGYVLLFAASLIRAPWVPHVAIPGAGDTSGEQVAPPPIPSAVSQALPQSTKARSASRQLAQSRSTSATSLLTAAPVTTTTLLELISNTSRGATPPIPPPSQHENVVTTTLPITSETPASTTTTTIPHGNSSSTKVRGPRVH